MAGYGARSVIAGSLLTWAGLGGLAGSAHAAGLSTDVALTPPLHGTILRIQFRYSRLFDESTSLGRAVHRSAQPITLAYGATEKLALIGTLPIIYRKIEFGSGATMSDTGVGDIALRAKYRFYQDDKPGKTTRWAVIGGLEIPTFDSAFSSESFDPIVGTVWTHQERDWWIDWDVIYKLNTRLTEFFYHNYLSVPWVAAANLIANKTVVPELVFRDAAGWDRAEEELRRLLADGPEREACLADLAEVRARMGEPGASSRAARWVKQFFAS